MSSTELPSVYQNIFYVYLHRDPLFRDIVYVGKGSRGRAWHCAESNSRGKDHAAWMNSLVLGGLTPDAWVEIIASNLPEMDAYRMEAELIEEYKPRFNSKKDGACKMTPSDLVLAQKLRAEGKAYSQVGDEMGLSTMTIYRALNGKTKNYVL